MTDTTNSTTSPNAAPSPRLRNSAFCGRPNDACKANSARCYAAKASIPAASRDHLAPRTRSRPDPTQGRPQGRRIARAGTARDERDRLMQSVETVAADVGVQAACEALAVPRSSLYATRRPQLEAALRPITPPPNALTPLEKTAVLAGLNSDRFADQTPYEVYSQLLDEGRYLCSLHGMYRILAENQAVCDRRAQLRHPAQPAPQVVARQPNQVWGVGHHALARHYQTPMLLPVLGAGPVQSLHRRLAYRREAKWRLRRATRFWGPLYPARL